MAVAGLSGSGWDLGGPLCDPGSFGLYPGQYIGDNTHGAIEKELSGVKYHRDILYPPDKIVR